MSDRWIKFIPLDPNYVPSDGDAERACAYLREIAPESEEVVFDSLDGVVFHDCGENLESIACPSCLSLIDQDWWTERMSEDFDGEGFTLCPIKLACCGKECSLNDLSYHFDQGFSRFVLEAMNPNIGVVDPTHILIMEEMLGARCRVIYQHI